MKLIGVHRVEPADDRPEHWSDSAACRDTDPETFFPLSDSEEAAGPAIWICRTCPVAEDCLRHALTRGEDHGVWGGLSARQRRALRKKHAIKPAVRRCEHCSGPLSKTARWVVMYCSADCRQAAYEQRKARR